MKRNVSMPIALGALAVVLVLAGIWAYRNLATATVAAQPVPVGASPSKAGPPPPQAKTDRDKEMWARYGDRVQNRPGQ